MKCIQFKLEGLGLNEGIVQEGEARRPMEVVVDTREALTWESVHNPGPWAN